MSVGGHLKVEYHQQDTDYYCGAACAQMVLDELGRGLLSQNVLYNENHSHSVAELGWYTAPDGLQWTMNHRQHHKYFALDALTSEDAISRKIAWTIHHYKVSAIALVYGWDHWIVVRGFSANSEPKSSNDASYNIIAFDVNNPWPPVPSSLHLPPAIPPPHSHKDKCGSGGTRGVANEHISYGTWQSTYMTGVPEWPLGREVRRDLRPRSTCRRSATSRRLANGRALGGTPYFTIASGDAGDGWNPSLRSRYPRHLQDGPEKGRTGSAGAG
jgi:hypothetical protein